MLYLPWLFLYNFCHFRIEFVSDKSRLGVGKKRIIEFLNGNYESIKDNETITAEGMMNKKIFVTVAPGLPNTSSKKTNYFILEMGPSTNDVTHLGGGGSAKRWCYSISLFSKMGDKGEGGVKNIKKWVTLFLNSPKHHH